MEKVSRTTTRSPGAALKKDRISSLPEELLVLVLSRLEMKEAARTSVLSRRWKDLWKFYSGCFDFDAAGDLKFVYPSDYSEWVNQVLDSHQGDTPIEELRISHSSVLGYPGFIDRWVDFAISKKSVRRLEFNLDPFHTWPYTVPTVLLSDCSFPAWLITRPLDFSHIKVLTSLRLKSVDLTEEVVQFFLSHCPMLDHLSVNYAPSLCNLTITGGNSLNLKHLEIANCFGLQNLHISASNLVFFKYWGSEINMLLKHVPKISSLSLGGPCIMSLFTKEQLPFPFSTLEELSLYLPLEVADWKQDEFYWFKTLPKFPAVRKLSLIFKVGSSGYSILSLISFVRASPRMEKLVLGYHISIMEERPPLRTSYDIKIEEQLKEELSLFKHECLKEVEFYGWVGAKADFDLASYLIGTAASLEKVVVSCGHHPDHPDNPWRRRRRCSCHSDKENKRPRARAKHLEAKLLSPRTELFIF